MENGDEHHVPLSPQCFSTLKIQVLPKVKKKKKKHD